MNKLLLVLLCSSYLCANSQMQVLHIALHNSSYEPEHKVFFSADMKDWKTMELERECGMPRYALFSLIALGVASLVGGFLWVRWYSKELPKV